MVEKFRNKLLKRTISLVVVMALFVVAVVGEHYINGKSDKIPNNNKVAKQSANSINVDRMKSQIGKLRSVDEIEIAVNDTEMGKISEELEVAYNKLNTQFNLKKVIGADVAKSFDETVTDLKNRALSVLSKTDDDNDTAVEYKKNIEASLKKLKEYSSLLCDADTSNDSDTFNKISELVGNEEIMRLSANDSSDNFADEAFDSVAINDEELYEEKNADIEYTDINVSKEDTSFTNDTSINDALRDEFSSYETVLDVYQYIKNNYHMQFYYGSRKGAIGTYEQKSGNDYDISSLLIGVLRDRGIPAKYVRGKVEITAEQAMEWTGAEDAYSAAKVMATLGIPGTTYNDGNGVSSIVFEHVWVLAYVPYSDYRGTGKNMGEKLWIPLDPSFKKVEFVKDVDFQSISDYIEDEANTINENTEINGVNVGELSLEFDEENSRIVKYMLENSYGDDTIIEAFGGLKIVNEDLGYLPLSTPYSVEEILETFDDISEDYTQNITVSVGTNLKILEALGENSDFSKKLYAPDIYGKRVCISYDPATEEDNNIINKYDGIFKTPAYLIKLIPKLYVDGNVVAEGKPVVAGTVQKYNIDINNASKKMSIDNVNNVIVAGGMYVIGMDYGSISTCEMTSLSDDMLKLKETITEENSYTENVFGQYLNTIAKSYFAQLDMYTIFVAGQNNVVQTRALCIGIVGFGINGVKLFGRTSELNEGGVFLDISYDTHGVVSLNNKEKNEKIYMLQSGIFSSAMEHKVIEQFTGIESVSTIKALNYAKANNVPIHIITKDNCDEEIKSLDVTGAVLKDVKEAIKSGKTVIIPEKTLVINQWVGSGYMVIDTDTFACGYMISGLLNGGSQTNNPILKDYCEQIKNGLPYFAAFTILGIMAQIFAPGGALILLLQIMGVYFTLFVEMEVLFCIMDYEVNGNEESLNHAIATVAAFATFAFIGWGIGKFCESAQERINNARTRTKTNSDENGNGNGNGNENGNGNGTGGNEGGNEGGSGIGGNEGGNGNSGGNEGGSGIGGNEGGNGNSGGNEGGSGIGGGNEGGSGIGGNEGGNGNSGGNEGGNGNNTRQYFKTNLGNEIDITPSDNHTTTSKNPGPKGTKNSSVDILDKDGNIKTRRWYDSEGKAYRDVDMTDHGNSKEHPEVPHEHSWDWSSGKPQRN